MTTPTTSPSAHSATSSPASNGTAAVYLFWVSLGWMIVTAMVGGISVFLGVVLDNAGPANQSMSLLSLGVGAISIVISVYNWHNFEDVKVQARAEMRAIVLEACSARTR